MHAGRQGVVGVQDWGRRGVESSVPSCKQILFTGIVLRRSRQSQRRRGSSVSGQASGREKVDDIYIIVVPRDVEYLYEK
jgi:hypothetical protein